MVEAGGQSHNDYTIMLISAHMFAAPGSQAAAHAAVEADAQASR